MKSAKMMRVLNFIWKYLGTFDILPQLGIQVVYSYYLYRLEKDMIMKVSAAWVFN